MLSVGANMLSVGAHMLSVGVNMVSLDAHMLAVCAIMMSVHAPLHGPHVAGMGRASGADLDSSERADIEKRASWGSMGSHRLEMARKQPQRNC